MNGPVTTRSPCRPSSLVGALLVTALGCGNAQSVVARRDATVDGLASDAGDATVGDRADVSRPGDVGDVPLTDGLLPDGTPSDGAPLDGTMDAPPMPVATTRLVAECGTVCKHPLDAIPNAAGTAVFFTAFTREGLPGIFRFTVPMDGSSAATPTALVTGNGMEFPVGIAISNDDNTLYVVDQASVRGSEEGMGAILTIPTMGGALSLVTLPAEFVNPTGIAVSFDGNDLLVTSRRRTTGETQRVLLRMPRTGGAPGVLASTLDDPSGISQASSGAILTYDLRRGGPRAGTVLSIFSGSISVSTAGLLTGAPAGVAFSLDGRSVLIAGADPAVGNGLLTWLGTDGRPVAPAALSAGMESPAGLHRARMANVWAVADESAGANGRVFLVTAR